jgi:hypothetical protein
MTTTQDRTVWFPKDSLLFIVLTIPLCGIAGLGWGLAMALSTNGSLIYWLFPGLLWGATMWFFFAIVLMVTSREVSTNLPLPESAAFAERLGKAVKRLRYTVEEQSSTSFVCKPKHRIARLFEFNKLHVRLRDGSVDLIGPAAAVNKVRKQLLADSPRIASPAAPER